MISDRANVSLISPYQAMKKWSGLIHFLYPQFLLDTFWLEVNIRDWKSLRCVIMISLVPAVTGSETGNQCSGKEGRVAINDNRTNKKYGKNRCGLLSKNVGAQAD